MADTISFSPDEDAMRALSVLTHDGTSVTSAIRFALIDVSRVEGARAAPRRRGVTGG